MEGIPNAGNISYVNYILKNVHKKVVKYYNFKWEPSRSVPFDTNLLILFVISQFTDLWCFD